MANKIKLEIVTAEAPVYADSVDMVIAPGTMGEVGILPQHAPLLTTLRVGEIRVKKDGAEYAMFVEGGFMEVLPDQVTILANTCERAEDIDEAKAQEAKARAEELMKNRGTKRDFIEAEQELHRNLIRLRVAGKKYHPTK